MLTTMTLRRYAKGITLIEVFVALAILGILMALALPNFQGWIWNTQLRNKADQFQNALMFARGEAIKRNALVRFQMVTTMDNACDLETAGGRLWAVSHGSPVGLCGLPENELASPTTTDLTIDPLILRKGQQEQNAAVQVAIAINTNPNIAGGATPEICFTGLGQLARYNSVTGDCTRSVDPGTTAWGAATLNLTHPTAGACEADGGNIRCLRIAVSSGGQVRMCDPMVAAPDPRAC